MINDSYSENFSGLTKKQRNAVFMNMSDAVITINENQEITYMNPAGESMFGISLNEAQSKQVSQCLTNKKSNRSFNRLILMALKSSKSSDNAVVTFDNGTTKKVLNIRISRINPKVPSEGIMLLVEDITAKHNLKKHERDCAIIFAGLIVCICIYLITWSLLEFTLNIHLKTSSYTLMIEGIAFILFLEIIFFTSMTPGDIGIFTRPKRLLQAFMQSIPLAAVICALMVILNIILRVMGHPVKPYFIGGSIEGAYNYIFTAILQEFLSRGVIQTSVKALMQVRYQKFFSIFLTSLLFALMHLPFQVPFMAGAFLLSIVLGIIYEKQENIWGCAFLHWSCGYLAMCMFF